MEIVTLKIKNKVYFISKKSHELYIQIDDPNNWAIQMLSEVVIDTESMEIIKCRKPVEDVIVYGLGIL